MHLSASPSRQEGRERRLLIVQKNPFVARSLARYVREHFDFVELAHSTKDAEAVLFDTTRAPTHLVCGQNLGPGAPLGSELVPRWREVCPGIQCAIIATTEREMPDNIEGIDAVFFKPSSPTSLLALLCAA
jgi:hypothetical protein